MIPIAIEFSFDETGHGEPWRNELAKELNLLLNLAAQHGPSATGEAILSVIRRVAQFEEIQVKQ